MSATTEMFGIALIVPSCTSPESAAPGAGASPIRDAVESGAAALGIPLTLPVLLGAFVLPAAVRSGVSWQR